jgi:glycine/D-amino acid oxidase-like deaminating enzyme
MFVHYFRKTPDGRVLMGSGSGPIAFAGRDRAPATRDDIPSAARAVAGLRRLLPGLDAVPVEAAWGGPIDIAADRLPFFRSIPGRRVHVAVGFSGHGVNPTWIAGQCFASLALGLEDRWTGLPFCTRTLPALPPEPFRTLGGRAIRHAILACETAEEQGRTAGPVARGAAALPARLGLRIGVR